MLNPTFMRTVTSTVFFLFAGLFVASLLERLLVTDAAADSAFALKRLGTPPLAY